MTLRAVVFDVDGTLADTERDGHRIAFNAAFREAGLDWEWDPATYGELVKVAGGKERLRHWIRERAPEFAAGGELDARIAELHAAKTRHFVALLARRAIPPRPGVARLLGELREAGIRLGIATTMSEESLLALLRSLFGEEAPGWFSAIGAGDCVAAKKPAPDVYRWVLAKLDLPAEECIAIEDSEIGLRAAVAAGIPTLVTVSPYSEGGAFQGALAVLSDLGEPGRPMRVIAGDAGGRDCVGVALLHRWHEGEESGARGQG